MKQLFFTICFALALASGSANAQLWSGNDYTQTCEQDPDDYSASICSTFVIGIAQAGKSNRIFCMPANVTHGQTFAIVSEYINDHPEERHLAASDIIVASLIEAFPCQPK